MAQAAGAVHPSACVQFVCSEHLGASSYCGAERELAQLYGARTASIENRWPVLASIKWDLATFPAMCPTTEATAMSEDASAAPTCSVAVISAAATGHPEEADRHAMKRRDPSAAIKASRGLPSGVSTGAGSLLTTAAQLHAAPDAQRHAVLAARRSLLTMHRAAKPSRRCAPVSFTLGRARNTTP